VTICPQAGETGARDDARVRVLDRLEELYAIGGGPGANRVGGSHGEDRAHELAAGWMREAGLTVDVDAHGNLVGRTDNAQVWTGSHLDSVPNGGKFDGALGVVAGIEAVERAGIGAVVAFRDEERGCTGSSAFVASSQLPACFLELHIEQGPVLADAGAALGIVTGIVGMVRGTRTFEGMPGHAGTVPMAARSDALVAAAEYVLRVREIADGIAGAVATVGQLEVEPGAVNVIPDRVTLSVDARAPDLERLTRLTGALELEPDFPLDPVMLDDGPRAALKAELGERGLPTVELLSGAGHDAAVLALAGVPTGMLFVRSLNGGVSHSPDELSSADDIGLAVDVLTGALLRLTRDD
jgi:acetylornithine deacetylase/succinyl-diaminopimelate desuccinylase-like protein